MTTVLGGGFDALRAAVSGVVLGPQDPGYDTARAVWNAAFDRRPAGIVRVAGPEDVAAAIGFARRQGWEITVRGGAHGVTGAAVADDALMIDLSGLCTVDVDPATRRARVGGGALLAQLDAATAEHGLGVPAGLISHTGIGGLTLGGGMGWLTRKFGLTIDNLLSAQVVLADGRIVRASPDEHPDLFWAIRGGGGNFGVATSFELACHPLDPMVEFGLFFWGLDQGPAALRLARELIATLPAELNAVVAALNAPPAPFVPPEHHFAPGYALLLAGFEHTGEHARLADAIRAGLPPLFDLVTDLPYVALQSLLDEAGAWGLHSYQTATYLAELSDPVIEVLTTHVPAKTSPLSAVLCYRLDRAYTDPAEKATAFSGPRTPCFALFTAAITTEAGQLAGERGWVRALSTALHPHTLGAGGGYLNETAEIGPDRVRAAYGPDKYDRLARIKAVYDPDNVFHHNANIPPAGP